MDSCTVWHLAKGDASSEENQTRECSSLTLSLINLDTQCCWFNTLDNGSIQRWANTGPSQNWARGTWFLLAPDFIFYVPVQKQQWDGVSASVTLHVTGCCIRMERGHSLLGSAHSGSHNADKWHSILGKWQKKLDSFVNFFWNLKWSLPTSKTRYSQTGMWKTIKENS